MHKAIRDLPVIICKRNSDYLHGYVESLDGVGKRPDGYYVNSCFGDALEIARRNPAGRLDKGLAAYYLDGLFHRVVVHVVQHDDVRAGPDGFPHFVEIAGLDLDFYGMPNLGAQGLHSLGD